jgi:hypothetical protein
VSVPICETGFEVRPSRKRADAAEILAGSRIDDDSHSQQSLDHDDGVVGPAAEALRTREQGHQGRIVLRPELHGAPGKVVKSFEVLPSRRIEGKLAAFLPGAAIRFRSGVLTGNSEEDEKQERNVKKRHVCGLHANLTRMTPQTRTRRSSPKLSSLAHASKST